MARKAGLPPGSLFHTGHTYSDDVKITVLDYDAESANERVTDDVQGLAVDGQMPYSPPGLAARGPGDENQMICCCWHTKAPDV